MNLSTLVEQISRVGPQYQKKLKKLGIKTVRDLLYHFPHRYEDFSDILPIARLKPGQVSCVQAEILEIENKRTWKRRMFLTEAVAKDDSGSVKIIWFNQPYLTNTLKKGDRVYLAGKLGRYQKDWYLASPIYEKTGKDLTHTGRIVPVYPETKGLSSRWLRFIIKPILTNLKNKISDPLPPKIKERFQLLSLPPALWQIHFPDSLKLAERAKQRFSFEELFFISLWVQRERQKLSQEKAMSLPLNISLAKDFVKSLPFNLTSAQRKSAWQILKDLEKPRPMNRLLEGDVGSGKTVVAAMAVLNAARAGYQTAFMAPTEILARQHFKTVAGLLKDFNISIGLLTGKDNRLISKRTLKTSRQKLLEKAKNGGLSVLIGTHALIQDEVKFKNLVLVVLDEQHRFGVKQRAKLCRQKDFLPHLLSMTATPIPRTLALTIYGDLDLSLIDELPKGRKKIVTEIVPPTKRQKTYDFIRSEIKSGRQVFVICPRIEPVQITGENFGGQTSKKSLSWAEVKAVKDEYKKLSEIVFPDLKIGMLHGKMKSQEKEKIMHDFKNPEGKQSSNGASKKIDILVSTSVVEVGVDVPNATVMMIEGAEKFGLAQLHQFRGRVGRSRHQSYCFLFTDSPATKTNLRLKALVLSEDGFKLAEKDLEIRGPGSINGVRQWGLPDLTMASLADIFLVEKTRQAAKEILKEDFELKKYPLLREELKNFEEKIHLE